MPIKLRTLLAVCVAAGIVSAPVLAATEQDSSSGLLLRGAKKWVEKGRPDRAKSLLNKLLTIEPTSQEGLFMLGEIELKNGNPEEAARYLRLLEKSAPNAAYTKRLGEAYRVAQNKKNAPPEKAAAQPPLVMRQDQKVGKYPKAEAAPKPKTEVAPEVVDPDILARTDALDALSDGNLELAETSLRDILKRRPKDAEVIGGLGSVRLKQGKPVEAEQWFTQALEAAKQAKGETLKWESLIETARFWVILRTAEALLDEGKLADAEATIQQALVLKPDNPAALAVLGNIKAAKHEPAEAERIYRSALAIEGYNVPAVVGLVNLLSASQRNAEALALLEQVLQDYPIEWRKNPSSQARLLREEGNLYLAENRRGEALKAMEKSVAADPLNAWSRFFLAKLYISLDLAPLGKRVVREGAELAPKDASMHYVRALVLLSLDDYAGGMDSLSKIPEEELTEPMRETRDRTRIQYYIQQAEHKLARGDRKEAIRIMSIAEAEMGASTAAIEQVAEGWFKLGLPRQGLRVMRKLPQPVPLETQVHYAFMLNRAKADQELAEYLPTLHIPERDDEETRKYRANIRDIEFDMAGRHFDQLLQAGEKEQAQQFAETVLSAHELSNAEYFRMRRNYFQDAALPENSIALLKQEKARSPGDLEIRMDLAYVYHKEKQDGNARKELQELLVLTREDDIDRRLRIAQLQADAGDLSGARKTMGDLTRRYPHNTQVLFQAGHIARASGQYSEAVDYFEQAKELSGAKRKSPATIAEQQDSPEILLELLPPEKANKTGGEKVAARMANTSESSRIYRAALADDATEKRQPTDNLAAQADQVIGSIEARKTARIEVGLDIQSRQSANGTSTYNAKEIPLVARFPLGYEAQGLVQVDWVSLDAGLLPATAVDAYTFGKNQAYQYVPAQALASNATGTSVGLGYQRDTVKADIGIVGIGFPVSNMVGGVRKEGMWGNSYYALNLSRRPVTTSVLAYAGATDPVTGAVWGGVTNTGLSLNTSNPLRNFNVTTAASYGILGGKNVLDNDRTYLRGGVDKDFYDEDDTVFNAGLSATFERYSKNQSFYTFGHGGYYSPQSSLTFGIPLVLKGRDDLFSYRIKGDLNYSTTSTDSAAYHPTDSTLQALAAANGNAIYQGGNGGGFGYALNAIAEYRAASDLVLGARLNIERSAYYAPNALLLYLRYSFTPEADLANKYPVPVVPYSQF